MPWSGGVFSRTNGTYTGSTVWASDAATAIKIQSSRHDTHDQDLANGINACLLKDGTNSPTANINWGGFNITNIKTISTVSPNTAAVLGLSGDVAKTVYFGIGRTAQEGQLGISGGTATYVNGDVAGDIVLGALASTQTVHIASGTHSAIKVKGDQATIINLGTTTASSATTPGSVVKKVPIYDATGTLLGYIPVYSSIT